MRVRSTILVRGSVLSLVAALVGCGAGEGEPERAAPSALDEAKAGPGPAPDAAVSEVATSDGGAGAPSDAPPGPPPVAPGPWVTIGNGVKYKFTGGGASALLVYGGYSALVDYSQGWADELVRARGTALGIGHLYAIAGPNTPGYDNLEIANSALVAHLAAPGRADVAPRIVIAAHSSGTFVSAELLGMMVAGRAGFPSSALAHVTLYNLDGGGGVPGSTLAKLSRAYFVYACDAVTGSCSHNATAMQSLGATHAAYGGALLVHADGSGCQATWCLHDTLVIDKPHNPSMYDLARDYTDFTGGRNVVTSYLDTLAATP